MLRTIARDDARVVVVFQIQHVPRAAVELALPAAKGAAQPPQRKGQRQIVCVEAVGAHALKLDHHVQFAAAVLRDVLERTLWADKRCLGQCHAGIMIEHVAAELLQILMNMRTVVI